MTKLNQILFAALILQIALISYSVFNKDEGGIAEPTALYASFDADEAKKITITGGDLGNPKMEPLTVSVSKDGADWVVDGTDGYPADLEKVKKLIDTVDGMKVPGPVVNSSAYFKKLEVSNTLYGRKVTIEHEGEALEFFLGTSPGLNKRHLRKVDADEVYVVSGLDTWDMGVKPGEWAKREYFEVPDKEVWAVTIENPKGVMRIERGPNDEWALLGAPPTKTLKQTDLAALVKRARSLTQFEPLGKADKPGYGLAKPAATVSLLTGRSSIAGVPPKAPKLVRWYVGADSTNGTHYAKADTHEHYIRTQSYNVHPILDKTMADYLED